MRLSKQFRKTLQGAALALSWLAASGSAAAQSKADEAPHARPAISEGMVEIVRDRWGVPSIFATDEADGYFGLGYAMLQDQPERFFVRILWGRGELASTIPAGSIPAFLAQVFPSDAPMQEKLVELDFQARLWDLKGRASAFIDKLDPQVRANYVALLRGVDAYISAHPEAVPAWRPRDIDLADVIASAQIDLWLGYQGGIGLGDCGRGGAEFFSPAQPPDVNEQGFSNEWALMPTRTSTGGAILLSDPHGPMDGRASYEVRLQAGDLNYAGLLHGPLPIVGRNAKLAWAVTTGSPDVADCYAITVEEENADSYLFDGEPRPIINKEVEISVLGQAARKFRFRYAEVNGIMSPIVGEKDGVLYAVSTPYLERLADFHNIANRLAKAETVDDFRVALGDGGFFPQNLLAADSKGDILYARNGLTPVRSDPALDWTRPVPGNSSAFRWSGLHSAEDMLTIKSPTLGYLQNNNVDPRFMDEKPHPEVAGLPEYYFADGIIAAGMSNNRSMRFLEAIGQKSNFSEADARALAFDTALVGTDAWLRIVRRVAVSSSDPFTSDLLSFDGRMEKGSTAALKYIYWREALREELVLSDVEELRAALDGGGLSSQLASKAQTALTVAAARLAEAPNGFARRYGEEFRIATGAGSAPMSGGATDPFSPQDPRYPPDCRANATACGITLLAADFTAANADWQRFVYAGSSRMQLHFLSPTGIRSYTYVNPGISDDPASPHAHDQSEELVAMQTLKPVPFDWDELSTSIESRLSLQTTR
ncbi:penicillin acylase family protein [Erythrobacter sp. NFXS35]|uniref:penicillin acylase family protein n=1 Tax=Erythrobacter sp. NFXS35 TaxID=2818436 RepID=UPI0032DECCC6